MQCPLEQHLDKLFCRFENGAQSQYMCRLHDFDTFARRVHCDPHAQILAGGMYFEAVNHAACLESLQAVETPADLCCSVILLQA